MTRITTLIAAAVFATTLPLAANADSYINTKQYIGLGKTAAPAKAERKVERKKRVQVRPAGARGAKTYNFGSFVRDTGSEGYGPKGGR